MVKVIGQNALSRDGKFTGGNISGYAMHTCYEARQRHGRLKSRPKLQTVNK